MGRIKRFIGFSSFVEMDSFFFGLSEDITRTLVSLLRFMKVPLARSLER